MDKFFYASSETCADLWYLSGFCAPDAFLFFQTDKGAVAAVSCLELGRARKECRPSVKVADVQHLEEFFGIEAEPAGGNWFLRMVRTVCRGTGVWEWNVPASFPLEYADLLRGAGIQVTPCWNLTPERRIKSREEIEKVRRGERLAEAGLADDPNAWIAVPFSQFIPNEEITVGSLLVTLSFADPDQPFRAMDEATGSAAELSAFVGDSCFTKAGSSYILKRDTSASVYSGSEESMSVQLKVTPSGEKSCTYSLTVEASSDYLTFALNLTGSSGRADLDASLHIKNMVKAVLEMEARISTTNQKPQSAPPAGDKIEHPAGVVGSGILEF